MGRRRGNTGRRDDRLEYLTRWASSLAKAAQAGALGGKPLTVRSIETVRGPRAGAIEIDAGLDAGKLLKAMAKDDGALHRQFIPWAFEGEPQVYMAGRYVRLEAGWPKSLAEADITLASLGQHPHDGGRWVAGKNETGATITLGLSDAVPHWLFGGFTGSGKTYAMRSAVAQLGNDATNHFVLIDAKWGDGLGCLRGLHNLMGPVAMDLEAARRALSWSVSDMRERYETGKRASRLIVVVDELQELKDDRASVDMIRRLAAQGRGARVHLLVGTQHPTQEVFGDSTIRRNLVGRVALRTEDYKSSEVVVGGNSPRADKLLGTGDCYAIVPSAIERAQLAYIPESKLTDMRSGGPAMREWPAFDPEAAGTLPTPNPANTFTVDPVEAAVTILAAHLGRGQPTVRRMIGEVTGSEPGGSRGDKLRDYGRAAYTWLQSEGWTLCDEP